MHSSGRHAVSSDEVSASLSRYLETMYYLIAEGEAVRPSRIAEWLGVAQPSVIAAVSRLEENGLVERGPGRQLTLSRTGKKRAAAIVRAHRIIERWLTDVIGLDWVEADVEAARLEHAFSPVILDRIYEQSGRPTTCPHGNTIPGAKIAADKQRRLSDLRQGERARVRRVSEVTEHEAPALLRFLADHGFKLNTEVQVVEVNTGSGAMTADVGGQHISMAASMADKVWVA
jgi:DtxR family Mn-dependent transcriptional regulator